MLRRIALSALMVGVLAGSLFAFPRRVLFEEFTAEW